MALSPELQTLIDVLHEPHREDGWQERLQDSYEDVRKTIPSVDDSAAGIAMAEMLRQRVDSRILQDVVASAGAGEGSEAFAAGIVEKAKAWGDEPLKARREVEVARDPRQTDDYFLNLDRNIGEQLRDAAVKADAASILNLIIVLLNMRNSPEANAAKAAGADANGASVQAGGGAQGQGAAAALPEDVITGMYQTAEGKALFAYMDEALTQANKAHGVTSYSAQGVPEGATSNSLDPDEMYEMFRTKIADDIQNGSFPITGLAVSDAEKIANIIKVQALDPISRSPWGKDYDGNVTYSFNPENDDLRRAIDVMLSGSQAVVAGNPEVVQSRNGEHVYTAGGYAEAYYRLISESNMGAAMTGNDMAEAFRPLLQGHYVSDLPEDINRQLADARMLVDTYQRDDGSMRKIPADQSAAVTQAQDLLEQYKDFEGQYIPPEINIPPERHQAFYNKVREAFDESARPTPDGMYHRDGDTFGAIMAEEFTVVEQDGGVREALRQDVFDHGPAMSMRLGRETENSVEVLDQDGRRAFEFADLLHGGFSVYSVSGTAKNFHLQEIRSVNNIDELRAVFGEEFDMRSASIPDFDLDSGNSQLSGYQVTTKSGNSFYIGLDATPESGTSDSFRADRQADSDTVSREPVQGADYTIGVSAAGMKR